MVRVKEDLEQINSSTLKRTPINVKITPYKTSDKVKTAKATGTIEPAADGMGNNIH